MFLLGVDVAPITQPTRPACERAYSIIPDPSLRNSLSLVLCYSVVFAQGLRHAETYFL